MWIHTKERGDFSGTSALFAVDRTAVQTNGDIFIVARQKVMPTHIILLPHTHTRDHRQTAALMIYAATRMCTRVQANVA